MLMVFAILNVLVLGACGNKTESNRTNSSSNKRSKKNDELRNYKNLKIGDKVSVNYAKEYDGKYAFDFTLNKVEFTDQSLGGEEPVYEGGFIIADVTITNTGKDNLSLDIFDNVKYGPAIFSYGADYGLDGLKESQKLAVGETTEGKIVAVFSRSGNTLTRGLEGTSTVFSYDIKADEIGDYVPE